ncbi:MAG: T9SS type A sorting domain-containing protein [Ignavibacteria bacterium]|nr:T9SS type A sorting domain-containing protein [Ignavibacteria bacterium]
MKFNKIFLFAVLTILANNFLFSQNPQHFTFKTNTGNTGSIVVPMNTATIDGVPLSNGDEIGAFTPDGLCVGAAICVDNANIGFSVWGNDELTQEIDGLRQGETIHFRFWKQSTDTEYENINVTYFQGSGIYNVNCYFIVSSLYYGEAPALLVPMTELPINGTKNVPIQTLLKWYSVPGATHYKLQVSESPEFETLFLEENTVQDTFFQVSNLNYLTQYHWRLQAFNQSANSFWCFPKKFTTTQEFISKPDLLEPLDGSIDQESELTLKWSKVEKANQYIVQVSRNASFSALRYNEEIVDTFLNISNLSFNSTYYWRVSAKKDNSLSDWTEGWSFSTQDMEVPAPSLVEPQNLSVNLPLYPIFRWNKEKIADFYVLQVSKNEDFTDLALSEAGLSDSSYIPKKALESSTKYFWRVAALSQSILSKWSECWSFTTEEQKLSSPRLEAPENGSSGLSLSVNFLWRQVEGASAYNFQLSLSKEFSDLVKEEKSLDQANILVKDLSSSATYFWRVLAKNDSLQSNWSETWTFTTTKSDDDSLQAPMLISPANNSVGLEGELALSWTKVEKAKSYHFQLSTQLDFSNLVIERSDLAETTISLSKLELETRYYWRVKAIAEKDESPWSEIWQFSTSTNANTRTVKIPYARRWSLISTNTIPEDLSIERIFIGNSSVSIVKNILNQRYIPNAQNEIGDWNVKEAYWVNSAERDSLTILGAAIDPAANPLSLTRGWTLLPYFLNFVQSCETTFKNIENDLLVAKDEDGNLYLPHYNFNTLSAIYPGMGLQCFFSKNATLIYENSKEIDRPRKEPEFDKNLIGFRTGSSAVLIATIIGYNGYKVAAYNSSDEMVGIGIAENNQAIFTVWGDDENTRSIDGAREDEQLSIKIYKDDDTLIYSFQPSSVKEITQNIETPELRYNKDAVLEVKGTVLSVDEPFNFHHSLSIKPNPAANFINVELSGVKGNSALISLYSINGEMIESRNLNGAFNENINEQFNLSKLSSGVYFIKYQDAGKIIIEKFIVL